MCNTSLGPFRWSQVFFVTDTEKNNVRIFCQGTTGMTRLFRCG
jgi:hypothetical protein